SQPLEKRIQLAQVFNDRLAPLFANGQLRPLPLETFSFENAIEAHKHMASNDFSGKRVIVVK
ncbi:zinc-binding dehydrogenase, partial [Flagellimonas olearia]